MWNTAKSWPLKSRPPVLLFISASRHSSSLVAPVCLCQSRLFQLNQAHKDTQEHSFLPCYFFVLTPSVRGKTLLLLLIFLSSLFLLSTQCLSAYSIKLKRWDRGCRPTLRSFLSLSLSVPLSHHSHVCCLVKLARWQTDEQPVSILSVVRSCFHASLSACC